MSTKTIPSPRELGKTAYDEVRGHQPLLDNVFVENYLTGEYSITEQFLNMREWFSGYKKAAYELEETYRKASKKKNTKANVTPVNEDSLPF